ncbi:MAG: outer membrane protein/peptidoglycan-associated (lipo)protein [Bacteroidetes bacterium]|nr:MAG: outer membrane protein/peptidoglycan-associated (lipo)protein [Bacteroidota bacterium]
MIRYLTVSLLFVFFMLVASTAFAQRNPAKGADEAFDRKQYSIALDRYKKAYGKVKKNAPEKDRINYRMAECYRFTGSYKRAEAGYRKVLKAGFQERNPEILLTYADLLKMNQKYPEAIEYYNLYTEKVPDDPRGPAGAATTAAIEEWLANPSRFEVTVLKKVNSRAADFAPAWASNNYNEVIFTSTRDGSTGKDKDGWTSQSFSDLYSARLDRNNQWSTPVLLDDTETLNTKANEGAPFMNSSFNTLYFTRCNNLPGQESGCQIYTSSRSGRSWSNPVAVQIKGVDSLDVIGHPSLSQNELIIYFATDRKGGSGGKDIWMAMRDSKKAPFNRPLNIGPVVNTKGDEVFPFLRNDTTLYFASNGHPGMGGFDIYVTAIDTSGNWGTPTNLKHPLNSINDDVSIVFHPTEERGFFSSNRENTKGVDNLFYFIEPPVLFTLAGTVKDEKTQQLIEDASVKLIGSNGSSVTTRTNDKGYYMFGESQLSKNTTYEIIFDKPNYFTKSLVETTVGVEFSRDFVKDIQLEPIPQKPIPLPDILYDLARWELKPQYEDSLQGLIETLQQNPTIIIELASHTDSRDIDERNDILSQRRAQSVVDYLIIRGIDPERLVAKGYGERVPRVIENDFAVNDKVLKAGAILTEEFINSLATNEEKEAAHQLNRRTEFRVLSKDFVPKAANQPVAETVAVVINPDDNQVDFTIASDGSFQAECFIDGFATPFIYNRSAKPAISLKKALEFLQKGIISVDNIVGEDKSVIQVGTIANGAVFSLKEVGLANKTLKNVEVVVDHKLEVPLVVGQSLLERFGSFEFDTKNRKLIFK